MHARRRSLQRDLLDSLWFSPTVIALLFVVAAELLLRADRPLGLASQGGDVSAFGGADGARGILFAIAGTSLTILTVVYSLTVVVLQIGASQFTPRVMRTMTGDRSTHIVLGVFLGTFTYALLVLRAVRSPNQAGGDPGFVPVAAVAVAFGLALVSIAFMIYYINHVARSVQVAVMIKRITDETMRLLGEPLTAGSADQRDANPDGWALPDEPGARISSHKSGYLEAIDAAALLAAAEARGLLVRTEAVLGAFLLAGAPLATVWPAAGVDAALAKTLRAAFVLGPERTRQQGVEMGLRQLADIALRALSPAVNDPTTATQCIDRLGELLVHASCRDEIEVVAGSHGRVVLRGPSFARLSDVAFTQIRHYGAVDVLVVTSLMTTLGDVAARAPAAQRALLQAQAEALLAEARAAIAVAADLERIETAALWRRQETARQR